MKGKQEEIDMKGEFNERLQQLIQRKGITQKELAIKAGVTEAAMSHYLKGDRVPRASVLAKIADSLGTSSDYLMNGTAENCQEEINQVKRLIARNASQMSHKEKMEIVDILFSDNKG